MNRLTNTPQGKNISAPPSQIVKRQVTTIERDAMELPPWMQQMRDALMNSVNGSDLQEIMQKQVERAKKGSVRAAKFVFDQAQRIANPKGMTVIQNNYYGGDGISARPDQKAKALPGSKEKIDVMRRRVEAGEPILRGDDAGGKDDDVDLS